MNITIVMSYTGPAKDSMGAERMIEALVKGFQVLGHQVTMKVNPDSTNMPAPVVAEVPKDTDIIMFNGWDPKTSQQEYDAYGIPWCMVLHGGGSESDPEWLRTIKNPHTICVSKFIADRIGTQAYVWSCSNPEDFIFREKKEDYFLWMAGFDWGLYAKGLFQTIEVAKKLNIKLKVAGAGKKQDFIDKEIKPLCTNKIEFIGSVNGRAKAELLSNAKGFFLLTQLPDACPLTISESLLSGTPIISSDKGCMPEIMNEKIGFICKNNIDIAKAVANINKIKPKNCYEYGMENFSHIQTAKKFVQYFENMIKYKSVV